MAIDANAIVHRAFHAYPPTLSTDDGVQVNAVFGFSSMLLKVLEQFDPKYLVCAFDTKKPTFRHQQFAEYKAHRKPTDKSLIAQFPLVEGVLEAFNIPIIKKDGFEADDILGTLAEYVSKGKWSNTPMDMIIVTGDRDLLQLVNGRVKVALPGGRTFSTLMAFTPDQVLAKYGYTPEQVVDYKAMVGDASDNIPGVKGVGDKTALGLLNEYGSLDDIYKNLTKIKARPQKLLGESVEQAEMSRDLATIKRDVDFSIDLESCLMRDFKRDGVLQLFQEYRFRSLVSKIPKTLADTGAVASEAGQMGLFGGPDDDVDELEVISQKDLSSALKDARRGIFCFISDQESTEGESISGVRIVDKSGEVSHHLFDANGFTGWPDCETYSYGLEDLGGISGMTKWVDIQMLGHNLSAGKRSYSLSGLSFDYLGVSIPEMLSKSLMEKYLDLVDEVAMKMVEESKAVILSPYAQAKTELMLATLWGGDINDENVLIDVAKHLEMPTAKVLRKMEERGVMIDRKTLGKLKVELKDKLEKVTEEIYKAVGHEFNINSPAQVAEILYDELRLLTASKSRTTRESTLKKIVDLHPVVPLILDHREISKILTTYIESYETIIAKTGKDSIHTDFRQLGTSSGRFSSHNPNMQNIPARGKWASRVREIFVARKGHQFVALDYSQIESRLMADISGDKVLIGDFVKDKDIHRGTAARVLGKPEELVTSGERSMGKTINFGILYGQTKYGLAGMLGIHKDEAQDMIENYFKTYKGVAKYVEHSTNLARKRGYVESMFGRRRYVPGLKSENRRVYEAAAREAINMPIQGGDADIMKMAMIMIDRMIDKDFDGKVYPLLQIHDEMIYESPEKMAEEFSTGAKELMESVIDLDVPLKANVSVGKSMADLKD